MPRPTVAASVLAARVMMLECADDALTLCSLHLLKPQRRSSYLFAACIHTASDLPVLYIISLYFWGFG
jgi:hypothetical protein